MKTRWRTVCGLLLLLATTRSINAADADVVRNGKRATALVQIGQAGFSSAFCVSSDGLFVTDRRASALPRGQKLKVIVNPSEEGEHVYDADLVATSTQSDMALFHIRDARDLTALSLGEEKTLLETQTVTSFGYPISKAPVSGESRRRSAGGAAACVKPSGPPRPKPRNASATNLPPFVKMECWWLSVRPISTAPFTR